MRIVISEEAGNVRGFAVHEGRAVDGALAVLAPESPTATPGDYLGFQTESDGSFNFRNVPVGRYRLFAIENTGFEYANPALVAPYRAKAKLIEVQPNGILNEQVELTPPVQ